mgnify:CR=1 FL=1|jgi:E3 ubiquitin-protein ligase BIG BROTHER-like protein
MPAGAAIRGMSAGMQRTAYGRRTIDNSTSGERTFPALLRARRAGGVDRHWSSDEEDSSDEDEGMLAEERRARFEARAMGLPWRSRREEEMDAGSDDDTTGGAIHDMTYEEMIALDEGVMRPGLPAARFKTFKRVRVPPGKEGKTSCSICLEGFCGGDRLVKLPCTHHFHADCITRWFNKEVVCPNCRSDCREDHAPPVIVGRAAGSMAAAGEELPVLDGAEQEDEDSTAAVAERPTLGEDASLSSLSDSLDQLSVASSLVSTPAVAAEAEGAPELTMAQQREARAAAAETRIYTCGCSE